MDSEQNDTKKTETTEIKDDGTTKTTTTVAPQEPKKASAQDVAARVVYYIGGVIMGLLAVRLVLALLGANRQNPFADFIFDISGFFAQPFFGLFSYEPVYGVSIFELSTLVAIIVYGLLTLAIARLISLAQR